jgi:hypothetical protein
LMAKLDLLLLKSITAFVSLLFFFFFRSWINYAEEKRKRERKWNEPEPTLHRRQLKELFGRRR